LGAPLARIEIVAALNAVLRRFPELALAEEPDWRDTIAFRAMRSMRVTF
jgi:cytochrome P450